MASDFALALSQIENNRGLFLGAHIKVNSENLTQIRALLYEAAVNKNAKALRPGDNSILMLPEARLFKDWGIDGDQVTEENLKFLLANCEATSIHFEFDDDTLTINPHVVWFIESLPTLKSLTINGRVELISRYGELAKNGMESLVFWARIIDGVDAMEEIDWRPFAHMLMTLSDRVHTLERFGFGIDLGTEVPLGVIRLIRQFILKQSAQIKTIWLTCGFESVSAEYTFGMIPLCPKLVEFDHSCSPIEAEEYLILWDEIYKHPNDINVVDGAYEKRHFDLESLNMYYDYIRHKRTHAKIKMLFMAMMRDIPRLRAKMRVVLPQEIIRKLTVEYLGMSNGYRVFDPRYRYGKVDEPYQVLTDEGEPIILDTWYWATGILQEMFN